MVLSGAFGRTVKVYPKLPKELLPWLVMLCGYVLTFGMAVYGGMGVSEAATSSWMGLILGVGAVGGHEALKGGIKWVTKKSPFDINPDKAAAILLGKLPAPSNAKEPRAKTRMSMLVLLLGLLPGCAEALQALDMAARSASYLSSAISVADAGQEAYFARHPSLDNEPKVDKAIRDARMASAALDAALAAGDSFAGDLAGTKKEALQTYKELRRLYVELGILEARAPDGGAESEGAPMPEPFPLPTAEDIGARL